MIRWLGLPNGLHLEVKAGQAHIHHIAASATGNARALASSPSPIHVFAPVDQ